VNPKIGVDASVTVDLPIENMQIAITFLTRIYILLNCASFGMKIGKSSSKKAT